MPNNNQNNTNYNNNYNNSNYNNESNFNSQNNFNSRNNYDNSNTNSHFTPRGGYRGRGRGRGRGRPTPQTTLQDEDMDMGANIPAGAVVVKITGHPAKHERELLNFLHRKMRADWVERQVVTEGNVTYITVDNMDIAQEMLRKDGFTFYDQVLSIALNDGSTPTPQHQPRQQQRSGDGRSNALTLFVQERWDPQYGYFNLDELPSTKHSVVVVLNQLLQEAKRLFDDKVITISVARNGLFNSGPIKIIADLFPNISNLSLADNDFKKPMALDALACKLPHLTELVLTGNPLATSMDPATYAREMQQRFPTLTQLDYQPLAALAAPPSSIPSIQSLPPVQPDFFDQPVSQQAAQDFLSKFFPTFDSNRSALAPLYDEAANFSIKVTPNCPAYASWSQGPLIAVGNQNIAAKLTTLPPSFHDLTRAGAFALDAWQAKSPNPKYAGLLNINIHGNFRAAQYDVGFDRFFILAPATENSAAQQAGWQYILLADSMVVRNVALSV
ncbi:NTF2-like protein [Hesseltinella vesiculosa]|uniref:NTF2-like protein n=1 Tax=Hesseltinella vesiculosa TaxID=101127 RepID=A0A1X2G8W7_9FUNG|nr:NTF2-like protein [Hesseltinella vesiculosa]